jgi:phosphatidate cytidylyltransferase
VHHDILMLLVIVAVGLTTATVIVRLLRRKAGFDPALLENVEARIRSWWVMSAIVAGGAAFGAVGLAVLFAGLSALAFREIVSVVGEGFRDPDVEKIALRVILPSQYLLILMDWYGLFAVFIPVYAFLALPLMAALRGSVDGFVQRVAAVQWGLMVAVFCLSHVAGLVMLDIAGFEGRGVSLALWVVFTVQLSDVLQFLFGKLFGRRLIAPRLSPSKTWEGFLGGILTASCVGGLMHWLTPFEPALAFAMALLLTTLGFAGGLILSAAKRDKGVKDWGKIVPGHGGIVDRLDSLVFSAPVFFHVVRYFWSAT